MLVTKEKFNLRIIRTLAYCLIGTLLFSSCAQVVSPGGGRLDKTPPKVLSFIPDSAQLNFTSKSVEITFDEYIQLKDLNSQLVISPPMNKTPDIKVKNKTLSIDLTEEDLKANTTYSIYFGNAVQDMNENNSKENFRYIFSTGNYLDSLSVKGKVQNAFDHKTQKGILVMLYRDLSDSAAHKNLPDYFSKTSPDGSFQILNIKNGNYKIVAINDLNGNYKYDGDNENIGFNSEIINPSTKKDVSIDLFQEPATKTFVKKYFHSQYGKIMIIFNQGTDSLSLTNLSNTDKGVQEFTEYSYTKDTLAYWIKNYQKDSLFLQVKNGSTIIDTLGFKMLKKEEESKAKKRLSKLTVLNNLNGNQNVDINKGINLVFSAPIAEWTADPDLKEDSIQLNSKKNLIYYTQQNDLKEMVRVGIKDSTNNNETKTWTPIIKGFTGLKENKKYQLFILPNTFTDFLGNSNDTIKMNFKTREDKYYGSLKLKVSLSNPKGIFFLVQLLDEKENVVRTASVYKDETIFWGYLYPQQYKLKIIEDANSNLKWDTGNYLKKIQPEKVIYNSESIMIRSNWDADLEWKITQ